MKTIAFIIPVFNESQRLEKTFTALKTVRLPRGLELTQVVFVNDGSTDNTLKTVRQNISRLKSKKATQFSVISYKQNRGKGYAIREGLRESNADYSLIMDADMSTPFSELKKFMPHLSKGVDTVIGTRKNGRSTVIEHQPIIREMLGKGFTLLTKLTLGLKGTDFTCGFKALSKPMKTLFVENGKIDRWGYDAELLFLSQKYNMISVEVPVVWSNDPRTKVNLSMDIVQTLMELIRIRKHDILGEYGMTFASPIASLRNAIK